MVIMGDAEVILKKTLKHLSSTFKISYNDIKMASRKYLKVARNQDENFYSTVEQLLDLTEVSSEEELGEIDLGVLKLYCRLKDLDETVSEKHIRKNIWEHLMEEYDDDEEEDDEDDELEDLEEEDELDELGEQEIKVPDLEPVVLEVKSTSSKKSKK